MILRNDVVRKMLHELIHVSFHFLTYYSPIFLLTYIIFVAYWCFERPLILHQFKWKTPNQITLYKFE